MHRESSVLDRKLMGSLIAFLGTLLSVGGGMIIKLGLDVAARDERGWTQVISGAVGLSAGIITIALGLLVMRLGSIRRDVAALLSEQRSRKEAAAIASSTAGQFTHPQDFEERRAGHSPPPHQWATSENFAVGPQAIAHGDDHPARGAASARADDPKILQGNGELAAPTSGKPAEAERRSGSSYEQNAELSGLEGAPSRRGAAAPLLEADWHAPTVEGQHFQERAQVSESTRSPGPAVEGSGSGDHATPSRPSPDTQTPISPVVVGQYEANGVSYIMYADGSIEADTPGGVYRFENIAELKQFIEHPETAK